MKIRHAIIAAAIGGAIFASSAAQAATTFDYSYTFSEGPVGGPTSAISTDKVTGSFTGTLNSSGLITGISNATAVFDGTAFSGPLAVFSYTGSSNNGSLSSFTLGGATASVDGSQNNFVFINATADAGNHLVNDYTNYFYIIQPWSNPGPGNGNIATQLVDATGYTDPYSASGLPTIPSGSGLVDYYNGNYNTSSWVLTAVPEPATWSMLLLGFLGIGFMARGSRRKGSVAVA